KEFLAAWTTGFNIYVSCQGDSAVGCDEAADFAVVYCDLTLGNGIAEHTGIYIGNNEIVHLNRHGFIEAVSPKEFLAAWTTGFNIYVSCQGDSAVGCDEAADFA
ncbi:hypothetical protein B7G60_15025, partial [Staphylococcus aureus]|uniref:hypothetical protein n=1 Tax=Staphylococcus aureus TaxID=1280 RepID=UPI000A2ECEB4